jgi:hypothetical protein
MSLFIDGTNQLTNLQFTSDVFTPVVNELEFSFLTETVSLPILQKKLSSDKGVDIFTTEKFNSNLQNEFSQKEENEIYQ